MSVFTRMAVWGFIALVVMLMIAPKVSVQVQEFMLQVYGITFSLLVLYYATIDRGRSWWLGNKAKCWFVGFWCIAVSWAAYVTL